MNMLSLYFRYFSLVLVLFSFNTAYSQDANVVDDKKIKEYEKYGENAVKKYLAELRSFTKQAGNSINERGEYFVSTDIININDIDKVVIDNIEARKVAIRSIINRTALDIENKRSGSINFTEGEITLTKREEDDYNVLSNAVNKNNVSIRSLSTAIKMVVSICNNMYNEATTTNDSDLKLIYYIEYAAAAYELSGVVIEMLTDFKQEGIGDINTLFNRRKTKIDDLKSRTNNRKKVCNNAYKDKTITKEEYNIKMKRYEDYISALDETMSGWDNVFTIIGDQKDYAGKIISNTNKFRDLREESGLQIDILAEISTTRNVLRALESIDDISSIAEDFPILPLDAEIARVLLGIEPSLKRNKKEYEDMR
jgi:hypothetical protein